MATKNDQLQLFRELKKTLDCSYKTVSKHKFKKKKLEILTSVSTTL